VKAARLTSPVARPAEFLRYRDTPLFWVRLAVAASVSLLVALWMARPWVAGDSPFVWDGTNAFVDCISDGDLVACRHREALDYWGLTSPIGDWPLLQHIPDLVAVKLGAQAHHTRELVFVALSVIGVAGSIPVGWLVLRKTAPRGWFWGYLVILLSGPLIAYARTTAGEALATGLLVCLAAAALLRAPPPVIGLAALAASLTKETSYPFVAAIGVLGLLLARRRTGEPIRRELAWLTAGILSGFTLASLFNIVRFGNILNTNYLKPELHASGVVEPLDYAVALLASPNGGMLVYWPAACALLAAACLLPLSRSGMRSDRLPSLVLIAIILGLTLGFASWWDPFGGGYGPRFTLPWVLPLVLIALAAYGRPLAAAVTRLLAPTWRLLLVFALVFALALPHVGHIWRPEATARFLHDHTCDAPWRGFRTYHACQNGRMWNLGKPMPLYSLEGVATAGGVVTSAALGVALLGALVLLRAETRVETAGAVTLPGSDGDTSPSTA
jgi:hypothetical protein